MTEVRTFDVARTWDAAALEGMVDAKRGRTVSVCLPCRNEAATIGPLVRAIRTELMTACDVVDELIVIDDRSTDDTARVAADAGARVVSVTDVHAEHGDGCGKGNALWASLLVSHGDFVVWCDGDVTSFESEWIVKLLSPLISDDTVALAKAFYDRPTEHGGGGRTTELVARPLMSRYFPELNGLSQPLSGEYAGRRTALEQLDFEQGWGVEIGLLIDVAGRFGNDSIAQVDLGSRMHRHRSLESLSVQAAEVMATMLDRALGPLDPAVRVGEHQQYLQRADGSRVRLNLARRPSLMSLGLSREPAA